MPEENAYGIKIKKIVNLPQTTKILRNNLEFNYYDYTDIYDDLERCVF